MCSYNVEILLYLFYCLPEMFSVFKHGNVVKGEGVLIVSWLVKYPINIVHKFSIINDYFNDENNIKLI